MVVPQYSLVYLYGVLKQSLGLDLIDPRSSYVFLRIKYSEQEKEWCHWKTMKLLLTPSHLWLSTFPIARINYTRKFRTPTKIWVKSIWWRLKVWNFLPSYLIPVQIISICTLQFVFCILAYIDILDSMAFQYLSTYFLSLVPKPRELTWKSLLSSLLLLYPTYSTLEILRILTEGEVSLIFDLFQPGTIGTRPGLIKRIMLIQSPKSKDLSPKSSVWPGLKKSIKSKVQSPQSPQSKVAGPQSKVLSLVLLILKLIFFRTTILILYSSIPQPWMFYRGHHNPFWHLSLQFWMWLKRWSVLFNMCSRIWSLLYGHCYWLWVYHILKYILHQKSRIS